MFDRCFFGFRNGTYALLHEDVELTLILDIDELLAAIGRVGNVQLERGAMLVFEVLKKGEKGRSDGNIQGRASRFFGIKNSFNCIGASSEKKTDSSRE